MRFKQYLTEKTFRIGQDVDLVYNKLYKPTHDLFKQGKYKEFIRKVQEKSLLGSMTSNDLKSKESRKANEINPVLIELWSGSNMNAYKPVIKGVSVITFNYHPDVINLFSNFNSNVEKIEDQLGSRTFKRFMNELSESAIKATIYHELSHWLNDTFHNRNITTMLDKAQKSNAAEIVKMGHSTTLATPYELDAQIHALKQLKRDFKSKWNDIEWRDIIVQKPSFYHLFSSIINTPEYDDYMKRLMKRMNRERLLTKKLEKYPNRERMRDLIRII